MAAQHSQDFSSWYSQVPGLKVLAPSTPLNAKGLLRSAIRDPNPVIFLENEILYGLKGEVSSDDDFTIPFGNANIAKAGSDTTIVTYSIMLQKSLEAAKILKNEFNLDIEVIDLQSLRPLDSETIINSVLLFTKITEESGESFVSICRPKLSQQIIGLNRNWGIGELECGTQMLELNNLLSETSCKMAEIETSL